MHARVLSVICVLLATATALVTTQAPPTTTSTIPPMSTIPPGYTYYPATGSYYKLHKSYVTWNVANTTCASEGTHLVVLNDSEEVDIVERIVRDGGAVTWIGLKDHRTGGLMDWRTVHGEPLSDVFNMWCNGRPTKDARFRCAGFYAYHKRLYDLRCNRIAYFTCEISQQ